jgi:serine phosphatase RsbU (regulator of sigma subunit)
VDQHDRLSQYDRKNNTFHNYFTHDGLQSNEFNPGSGCRDKNGILYFGGNKGFNIFNPQRVQSNKYIPEIVFTSFTLFKKPVKTGGDSPLANSITYSDEITLSWAQSVFGFTFAALNYNVPERNQYAYKMEGFDEQWVNIGNQREVNYTNLSPGTYTFKVKAANNDGLWNEKGISVKVIITPPFWKTKWFYALCAIVAAFLIWIFIKWRERSLQQEKKVLEEKVEHRTEQIKKQNEELESQKEELSARNRDITDSIRYAKRIQEAILPPMHIVETSLGDHFVLYRPKDIVSGDFYWVEKTSAKHAGRRAESTEAVSSQPREMTVKDPLAFDRAYRYSDVILVAAVDCTGHGVPGALVSIVGSNGLHRAVNEFGLSKPSLILGKLHELVIESLHQGETDMKDGMDISICSINRNSNEVHFSGANNPLYIISKNAGKLDAQFRRESFGAYNLFEIKGDKQPVGGKGSHKKAFTDHKLVLEEGETIYLFSDGYADQFGGERGKKFKYSALRELLLTLQEKSMGDQKRILSERFDEWKGDLEQVDDICIIGIKM